MDSDTLWQLSLGMVWFILIGKVFIRLNEKYEGLKQLHPLARNLLISAFFKFVLFSVLFFGPLFLYVFVFLEKP